MPHTVTIPFMTKKIGLVTTKEGVVSGVTIVMDQIVTGLRDRGFDVDLVRPIPTSISDIPGVGYILQYAFLRETFAKYDVLLGNGVGLVGAIDLSMTLIDTIHSTSLGANAALLSAYESLDPEEREPLTVALQEMCQTTIEDLPASFATKGSAFEIDKRVAARADKIVTVSGQITKEVETHFEQSQEKIVAIPNGVAPFWFEQDNAPREMPAIVYSGRAVYTPINIFLKGFDRVLSLFETFRDAQRVCILHIGNESFRERVEGAVQRRGVDCISNLTQQEIAAQLCPGDIFINTSRYEAFGLSLIESMAAGLVPVTFATGVVPEIISDGENGFVVSSLKEMEERVAELRAHPEQALAMGKAARETIQSRFSLEKMIDGYARLLS